MNIAVYQRQLPEEIPGLIVVDLDLQRLEHSQQITLRTTSLDLQHLHSVVVVERGVASSNLLDFHILYEMPDTLEVRRKNQSKVQYIIVVP